MPARYNTIRNELLEFIDAVANQLEDFKRYQVETDYITGREMLLCNMTHFEGEAILPGNIYPLQVPKLMAVDHRKNMMRQLISYGRKGLEGYINNCVPGTKAQALLHILSTRVFKDKSTR
ncbi:MAG: hypothetical protein WDO15_11455 [Bacteroidota bacterium]